MKINLLIADRRKVWLFVGAVLLLMASTRGADASLQWEQKEVVLHPNFGAASAVAQFKYKNTGDKPVRFVNVRTSCGCTTTAMKKEEVAPGESGQIDATFKIGASTGTAEKTVRVETDDPAEPVTTLVLRAEIPSALNLKPTFVYWKNSEPAKSKVVTATTAASLGTKNLKVSSSTPEIATKVTPAGPNQFKIEVTPKNTSNEIKATITVETEPGGSKSYISARVINSQNQAKE